MKGPRQNPSSQERGGAGVKSAADFVVQFARVDGSSISNEVTRAVLFNVAGIGGFDFETGGASAADANGEATEAVDVYSALGIVGRPLRPAGPQGAEAMTVRTQDGLVPFAYRDLRLKMGGSGPAEGVLAFVGYGGGFHSLTPVDQGEGGTIHVVYCPYDFDADGVAQKAHTIILDPTPDNESIVIAHAEGMAITMFDSGKKELTLKNAAGTASLRLDDDGVTITATRIVLSGGVIVGDPATALPLLPGIVSQGSTKFWLSA